MVLYSGNFLGQQIKIHVIGQHISWKFGDGDRVHLGIYPFVGGDKNYMFHIPLIGFLNGKGYISLAHINKPFSLSMGTYYRLNGENHGL